jgi:glutamine amidotransferase
MADGSVVLVDLGLGNLGSVRRALVAVGSEVRVSSDPDDVLKADRLVVPGQGAFGDFADALEKGHGAALREALASGKPYLGICLGMQGLFEESAEAPGRSGLAHFAGRVEALEEDLVDPRDGGILKVPHMGWNLVRGSGFSGEPWFYFVHSYVCVPEDHDIVIGEADYGRPICAAIARDNVLACQFHPEKSQAAGEAFLRRFLEIR